MTCLNVTVVASVGPGNKLPGKLEKLNSIISPTQGDTSSKYICFLLCGIAILDQL